LTYYQERFDFQITPDSRRVIYTSGFGTWGLYSVALTGDDFIALTENPVHDYILSPDGQWVVYWRDALKDQPAGLYSVATTGGVPVYLGIQVTQSSGFQISPDSRYVVAFAARQEGFSHVVDLYSAPIAGGASVTLTAGLGKPIHAAYLPFKISPDSRHIVFATPIAAPGGPAAGLYRVPITGGAVSRLDDAEATQWVISDYEIRISPNGQWVVYRAILDNAEGQGRPPRALRSVPLMGGPVVMLTSPLVADEQFVYIGINPDSRHVRYGVALHDNDRFPKPYSVPIEGGTPVETPNGVLSNDGRWLVWRDVEPETSRGILYSMSAAGGAPIQLSGALAAKYSVEIWAISPDSRYVFFTITTEFPSGMPRLEGLYRVPISGGELVELTGEDQPIFAGFMLAPDGSAIFRDVDYDGDGRSALYAFDPGMSADSITQEAGRSELLLPWLKP
jgi:hypothetical protein